jgi:iron complex outermembrane recepter protein
MSVQAAAVGFMPRLQTIRLVAGDSTAVIFTLAPGAVLLDQIVAIGTRAAERTARQSLVPVDVISSDALDNTGMPETWQQLQRLAPSVNVPHVPIGDNHARPVTLRGLLPHHVLVLVNGKRRHPAANLLAGPSVPAAAFTDLNAIPTSVIERIEILRDGAAAQYGSDAIGGVVNIVLKTGARRDAQTSFATVASNEGGRRFSDGHLYGVSTNLGVAKANGAYVTASAQLRDRAGTNRAYPDARAQYFPGDARNGNAPQVSSHFGTGSTRDIIGFLNAATPLAPRIEAYTVLGASDRRGSTPDAFFRRPLDPRTVRAIHPNGFLPVVDSRIGDVSALTGVRGTTRDWRWDVSSTWGRNAVEYMVRNSNNASLGAQSPTEFDAGRVAASQWTNNADVSRDMTIGDVPIGVAGGVEFRVERYSIEAGEPDSWRNGEARILDGPVAGRPADVGSQGLIGFRPLDAVSAQRQSAAGYLEVNARPLRRLTLQAALRGEDFSSFGSTWDAKLGGRLEVLPSLSVRSTVGTGFRAPSLSQEYLSGTRTAFQVVGGVTTVLTTRTFPVNTPEAQLIGATTLQPEQSLNRSAGLVFDRPRWPVITADFYQIDLRDRIGLGASVTDTSLIRLFEANGMRGINGGNYFANALDVRTRGFDVMAHHGFRAGPAILRFTGGFNHTKNTITSIKPQPAALAGLAPVFSGRMARGVVERGQPRETITLTSQYDTGPWGLALHNQRFGATAQLDQSRPEADQQMRAKWITDIRLSYRLGSHLQVAVNAANLFDVYPDDWFDFANGLEAPPGPSMQGIFRHAGGLSPFGMTGRTLHLQFSYR